MAVLSANGTPTPDVARRLPCPGRCPFGKPLHFPSERSVPHFEIIDDPVMVFHGFIDLQYIWRYGAGRCSDSNMLSIGRCRIGI